MPESYYHDALKLGQKEAHACAAKGQYPYLPVLDSFLSSDKLAAAQEIGLQQVPAEFVVGTRTEGRATSFARNFMPLLSEGSEFATKWQRLCQAHLTEGIRDAVKVYEYMNRYYVQEGNKRVSVLKFFDAVTIPAMVYRVLPERTDDREVVLYYEFLDFFRASKVNFLEFSKPGSYTEFLKLVGKAPGEAWSTEERSTLTAVYYYFRQAYEASGGKRLSSTVGDALLAYLRVYGYQSLCGKSAAEIKKLVSTVWEDISLQQQAAPIAVKLNPEEKKAPLLDKVLAVPAALVRKKVAFLYDKTPELSGWTRGHEEGRRYVQAVLGDKVETIPMFGVMESGPEKAIRDAVAQGCSIIFTTSPRLLPASLRVAVEYPEVTILNCSLNQSHRYIRTYYARMYEPKFIIGAMAGALAGGNPVGYVADYPIFGQIAGINAFAAGVAMTNPRARVYLEWSGVDSVEAATKRLTDRGITLISSQDMTRLWDGASSFGLSLVTEDNQVLLAAPEWRWGVYYEAIIRRILDRTFKAEYAESTKALNYYWGMSAGVVALRYCDTLPDGIRKLGHVLEKSVRSGICEPFRGPIYAQGGRVQGQPHNSLSPEQIINMDWLLESVVGSIPTMEQLNDVGKDTALYVGVQRPIKNGIE